MAYNFISLVNDVLSRVNEVNLTSGNFSLATGFNADVKNAVNLAINEINTKDFVWPFNHVDQNVTLVVNQVRYNLPITARTVAWDTFRIKGNSANNYRTQKLMLIDYEHYLDQYCDVEYRADDYKSLPTNVFRDRSDRFGVILPPDKPYELQYEFYTLPVYLEAATDVPTIPEPYKYVIHNGAMHYAYMFRGDVESASITRDIFDKSIETMRTILVNKTNYVRAPNFRR